MEQTEPDVGANPGRDRYELWVDGRRAGLATYRRTPGQIEFVHTEIDDEFAGRGLASALARAMLDQVPADVRVLPSCPFVAHYVETHPEYQPLVER